MKKIIFALILSLLFCNCASAANGFKLSLEGNNTFKDSFVLYLNVEEVALTNGSCKGVCSIKFNVDYDFDKLVLIEAKGLNNFIVDNNISTVTRNTGVSTKTQVLELHFENIGLKSGEKTTVKVKDILVGIGNSNEYMADEVSKTITSQTTALDLQINNNGGNNNKPNNNPNNKSSNNFLSSIVLSNGVVIFDKNTTTYNVSVDENVSKLTVTATAEDQKATIIGNGSYELNKNKTEIVLTVKAENGSEKKYTLIIQKGEPVDTDKPNNDTPTPDVPNDNNKPNTPNNPNIDDNNPIDDKNDNKLPIMIIGTVVIIIVIGAMIFITKKRH